MGKHQARSSGMPLRSFIGILLAVVLVGAVGAGAVATMGSGDGGDGDTTAGAGPSAPEPGSSPPAGDSALPDLDEEVGPSDEPSGSATPRDRSRKPSVPGQRTDASQKDLAAAVEDMLAEPETPPTSFRVASFNVLGHSHTAGGGNKPGFASGPARMRMALQVLRGYGIDLVGLQEFEPIQNAAFLNMTNGAFATYPGMKLGRKGVRNSVAWRTDTWSVVSAQTFPVPYFRGKRVPMPYVNLEHKQTGQRVWVINIHNPTSNAKRGNNERWRDLGTRMQASLASRLHARTGEPVLLMGDFNEREEAFCSVTRMAPMAAAQGGSKGGACRLPGDVGIDWIFGTYDIAFTDYARTRAGLVARASDHPIVVADATVTPGEDQPTG